MLQKHNPLMNRNNGTNVLRNPHKIHEPDVYFNHFVVNLTRELFLVYTSRFNITRLNTVKINDVITDINQDSNLMITRVDMIQPTSFTVMKASLK